MYLLFYIHEKHDNSSLIIFSGFPIRILSSSERKFKHELFFFSNFKFSISPPPQQYINVNFKISIFDCCKDLGKFVVADVLLDIEDFNNENQLRTFSHDDDKFEYSMLAHHKLSLFELSQIDNEINLKINKIPPGDHCLRFLILDGCLNSIVEDFNFTLP